MKLHITWLSEGPGQTYTYPIQALGNATIDYSLDNGLTWTAAVSVNTANGYTETVVDMGTTDPSTGLSIELVKLQVRVMPAVGTSFDAGSLSVAFDYVMFRVFEIWVEATR
jgi:hypothetical protein